LKIKKIGYYRLKLFLLFRYLSTARYTPAIVAGKPIPIAHPKVILSDSDKPLDEELLDEEPLCGVVFVDFGVEDCVVDSTGAWVLDPIHICKQRA
jgi:hypothetical protein